MNENLFNRAILAFTMIMYEILTFCELINLH